MRKDLPKLLIIGHGRHGKDTVAELFRTHFGYIWESSSKAAARLFLYEQMKAKYNYSTFEECYEDRHLHRQEWFKAILDYNKDDRARLAKYIMTTSNLYCGMRSREELSKCRSDGLFELVIWVDASKRGLLSEGLDSMDLKKEDADIVLDNGGNLEELERRVIKLGVGLLLGWQKSALVKDC